MDRISPESSHVLPKRNSPLACDLTRCPPKRRVFAPSAAARIQWGGCAQVWTCGRPGKPRMGRVAAYPDRASARQQVERLIYRRLRHQYQLVA